MKPDIEFASPEWIEAAREYLTQQAAQHADEIGDASFAVCEVFSDPPPHLAGPDGRLVWHARITGSTVTVDTTEIDADFKVFAPYHVVIPIARTVYGGDPAVAARTKREVAHRFPTTTRSSSNPTSMSTPNIGLAKVLGGLHDHVAPRTMDDPDLARRTAAYGLTAYADELLETGRTVIKNAFTDEYVAELLAQPDVVLGELRRDIWVTTLVEHACGPDYSVVESPDDATCTAVLALGDVTIDGISLAAASLLVTTSAVSTVPPADLAAVVAFSR